MTMELLKDFYAETAEELRKASAIEMTDTAVKLKVVIEQMREQVQNLQ